MRYLLNTLPSWMFISILMIGFSLIALLTFFVVRRFFPKLLTENMSPAFGVMGTSYGFLLGFVIAILWQNYTAATHVTASEAANFSLIINDLQELAPVDQLKIVTALQGYTDAVKNLEWNAMRWGESDPLAWRSIHTLYSVMHTIHPVDELQKFVFTDILKEISGVVKNRSARIQDIDTILPFGVVILLILGAIFIVYSVSVNDTKNSINHLVSIIMVCFLLSFNLGVAIILSYPFSGDNAIAGEALIKIIPLRLKLLSKQLKEHFEKIQKTEELKK